MKNMFNEGNQIHNFMSSSDSGTVINYGSGSDFLTSYGSGSTSQKVTVPTVPLPVPVPQHWGKVPHYPADKYIASISLQFFYTEGKRTEHIHVR
jgi:hypothetical protein